MKSFFQILPKAKHGVGSKTARKTLQQLEDNHFITPVQTRQGSGWKVHLRTEFDCTLERGVLMQGVIAMHTRPLKVNGFLVLLLIIGLKRGYFITEGGMFFFFVS